MAAQSYERPGPTTQLAAIGPQDVYVSMNPEVTSFAASYKQHSPFASTPTPVYFPVLVVGGTSSVVVPHDGDVLSDMCLEIRLPVASAHVGKYLVKRAKLIIDDVVIQDHERLWFDACDRVHTPRRHRLVQTAAKNVYVPLKFIPNLPLVAMYNSVIKVEIELDTPSNVPGLATSDVDVVLLCTYVDLDAGEKATLRAHEQLLVYSAPQDMDELSYNVSEFGRNARRMVKVDLSECNHIVTHFLFVLYHENSIFVYEDCLESVTFLVNGQEQQEARAPGYFQLVQKYTHCDAMLPSNVSVYSFALRAQLHPENKVFEVQPSGGLNFSVLKTPQLQIVFREDFTDIKCKVFVGTLNWLRVSNGFASTIFT